MLTMKLPELNNLQPNEFSTFKKLVEEIAECNDSIKYLDDWENSYNVNIFLLSDSEIRIIRKKYKELLNNVLSEIVDVAQVCASQLFVFERKSKINSIISEYKKEENLTEKNFTFFTENNIRNIRFSPKTTNSLKSVMNEIISYCGNIAQLSKFSGENGETPIYDNEKVFKEYVFNLIKIMNCCFTLISSMKTKYSLNVDKLFEKHIKKLKNKGYLILKNNKADLN